MCPPSSRRSFFKHSAFLLGWPALAVSGLAQGTATLLEKARRSGATAKIKTEKLRDNLYLLSGSGGNIAVLATPQGKLLVDTGISTSRNQILKALEEIGGGPVSQVIDTHWHFDHTDGNAWLHEAGSHITAHVNTRKRLASPQTIAAFNASFPPAPEQALPQTTFDSALKMQMGGHAVALSPFEPAHTDSDIYVWFTNDDVFHTGDVWFNGSYPFIDLSSGGNIEGMIRACRNTLGLVSDSTIIIPGHGPLGRKDDLARYTLMLEDVGHQVAGAKRQGLSLEEVIARQPTRSYDQTFSSAGISVPMFLGFVYAGAS